MSTKREVPESVIAYVLIGGLVLSVSVEVLGIALYYQQSGGFGFDYAASWQVTGPNFFLYVKDLLVSMTSVQAPMAVMALGIVLLMLTSYACVFATFIYFGSARNLKYALVSAVLFLLLTLTLLVH